MKHFVVIRNIEKDPGGEAAGYVKRYLEERGATCQILLSSRQEADHYSDPSRIEKGCECVITIGGDGTLIRAARDLRGSGIPLVGINLGNLGYLTEIDRHSIPAALDKLLEGQGQPENRMMLRGRILRNGKVITEESALNDIVFGRISSMNVLVFQVSVNGQVLNSYHADGMIVSTPTGSTAYNLSVGGPIVAPEASLLLMTPISPHSLINRSIVLPDSAVIHLELLSKRNEKQEAVAAFDGGINFPLESGDILEISRSEEVTRILKLSHVGFLDVLRDKMKES